MLSGTAIGMEYRGLMLRGMPYGIFLHIGRKT